VEEEARPVGLAAKLAVLLNVQRKSANACKINTTHRCVRLCLANQWRDKPLHLCKRHPNP
jgi:hypothetical protein